MIKSSRFGWNSYAKWINQRFLHLTLHQCTKYNVSMEIPNLDHIQISTDVNRVKNLIVQQKTCKHASGIIFLSIIAQ